MRTIIVMFDTLNRHYLPNYGCGWIHAPNFERLGTKTVTFDNCYAGSLPCIPARRELHTGRYNFLHRSWGPMEPFDDSMPEILKKNGIYSHLVTDHIHYFEDGGCTYHTRYSSWEVSRGQEGDQWKGQAEGYKTDPNPLMNMLNNLRRQDTVNRKHLKDECDMPQAVTFKNGLEFIENNHQSDHWFLQLETFDPHEPFFSSERFKELYPDPDYMGEEFDWPPYAPTDGYSKEQIRHCIKRYASLVSMCDYYLGQLLDAMDQYHLWDDTLLIVNTDHGFLLGEHGWWAKGMMPLYNEISHTPLFIWDPRWKVKNERRKSLVQTIDLPATVLEYFHLELPKDMQGKPLKDVIRKDTPVRETALFGDHGEQVNITDGRYVYMRNSVNPDSKVYEYTLMPTHMRNMFTVGELQNIQLSEPFRFTKGCRLLKIETKPSPLNKYRYGNKLFDLEKDPGQLTPIDDIETEVRLTNSMREMMRENDAPDEQYDRLGVSKDQPFTAEDLIRQREERGKSETFDFMQDHDCSKEAYYQISGALNILPPTIRGGFQTQLAEAISKSGQKTIDAAFVSRFVSHSSLKDEDKRHIRSFMKICGKLS